jgi:hypothetical protein
MRFLASTSVLFFILAACGDDSTPGSDAGRGDAGRRDGGSVRDGGGGRDSGTPGSDAGSDAGDSEDAGGASDGGVDAGTDAGGEPDAGCMPPVCPPPLPGCMYVGSDPCTCGMLVCASECEGSMCAATEYCDYSMPFACGGPGTCTPRPEICLGLFAPVCGCDGMTYSNSCVAASLGTDYASEGECGAPSDCRTMGCPAGETCEPCRGPGGPVYVCLPPGVMC